LYYLGWNSKDVISIHNDGGVTGESHVAPLIKVTNSEGRTVWVYDSYGSWMPYENKDAEYMIQGYTAW
jgi:hypothetical protein